MNKLSKEKQQQIIALVIGVVVGIFVIWYLFISPWSKAIAKNKSDATAKSEQIGKAEKLVAMGQSFQEELDGIQRKLKERESQMASSNPYFWMNQTIEDFKKTHPDVEISSVGAEQYTQVTMLPKFPYRAVTFNLSGNGFYHDIGKFIANFENEFTYMRIQNLSLEPTRSFNPQASERLSFDFQIVALLRPAEEGTE